MTSPITIKTIKEMLDIYGQPDTSWANNGAGLIRFLPDPYLDMYAGKSNLYYHYIKNRDLNKLKKQQNGWYHIKVTDNPAEKLEWCFTALGRGSNNKKAMWRTRWIQADDVRLGFQSYVDIYLHPDSAALYKLFWDVKEIREPVTVTFDYEYSDCDWK